MNRQRYLAELSGLLSFLSEEERLAVLRELEEKFDAATTDGEEALIAALGTPMRLAIDIHRRGIVPALADVGQGAENTTLIDVTAEPDAVPEPEKPVPAEEAPPAESAEAEPDETEAAPEPAPENEAAPTAATAPEAALSSGESPAPAAPEDDGPVIELLPELPPEEMETAAMVHAVQADSPALAVEHHESFPELTVARGQVPPEPAAPEKPRFSILGFIGFVLLLILPGIPLLALSVAVVAVLLALSAVLGAAGAACVQAGLGAMGYIPDAMFVLGLAFLIMGAAVLLLTAGLGALTRLASAWQSVTGGLYRRLVRKEGAR